jgi:hypothetical protein
MVAKRRLLAAAPLLALVVAFGGCKPKPGDRCRKEDALFVCVDDAAALYCGGYAYQAVPCKGRLGCKRERASGRDYCDQQIAAEGDPCLFTRGANYYACSRNGASLLVCAEGGFTRASVCSGPGRCAVSPDAYGLWIPTCDTRIAENEQPCTGSEGRFACSKDGKTLLDCAPVGGDAAAPWAFRTERACGEQCIVDDAGVECVP